MALIKCKNCGQMISDKAMKCPKCGYKNIGPTNDATVFDDKKSNSNKWLYAIIAVLTIMLLGGGAFFLLNNKDNDTSSIEITDTLKVREPIESEQPEQNEREEAYTGSEVESQQGGIRCSLEGIISTIDNAKLELNGNRGTLSYVMDGKRIVSNIVLDDEASEIDEYGFGFLVLKSYSADGKLKGRFIGEMDSAECGFIYEGHFVNVNGGSTDFLFSE